MGGAEVMIANEEDLEIFLQEANTGKKLILTKYGVVNVASIDSILPHKEKMAEVKELLKAGIEKDQKEAERGLIEPSPFAKLLSGKMVMLSDKSRTGVKEEFAREERKLN